MAKLSVQDLENINQKHKEKKGNWIKIGMSTCGIAAGADEIFNFFSEEIKKRNIDVEVKKCGCLGMCFAEPMVEVNVDGALRVVYGSVNKEVAAKILDSHIVHKNLVSDHIFELEYKER